MIRCLIAILALAVLAGCSASRYDADYAARVTAYRAEADFAALAAEPTAFSEDRLRLRLPLQFAAAMPADTDASRAKPPFLQDFPGFTAAHEAWLGDKATRLQATLSIGLWRGRQTDVEKSILAQVVADEAFSNTKPTWEKVAVTAINGEQVTWNRLALEGKQVFQSEVAGNPESKKWDGACQIWVAASPRPDFGVVLVWRVPNEVAGQLKEPLAKLAEAAARTVQFPQAAAPTAK